MASLNEIIQVLSLIKEGMTWEGSKSGAALDSVEAVDDGLKGFKLWFRARFTENGKKRELYGTYNVFGKPGDQITLDGVQVDHDDVILAGKADPADFSMKATLEFRFVKGGQKHSYLFTGSVFQV